MRGGKNVAEGGPSTAAGGMRAGCGVRRPVGAAFLALIALAARAGWPAPAPGPAPVQAFRVEPGSMKVEPAEVFLTRTVTLTAVIQDTATIGADSFDAWVQADPPESVRLVRANVERMTCKGPDRVRVSWVYEALMPGRTAFLLQASIAGCREGIGFGVEEKFPPIEMKPVPVWSGFEMKPDKVAPGDEFELVLKYRNDAPFAMVYSAPGAEPEFLSGLDYVRQIGKVKAEPAASLVKGKLYLPPNGAPVSIKWRYKALATGSTRFQVFGGGMIVKSPSVTIRRRAVAEVGLSVPVDATAVGRELRVHGGVNNAGEAGIAEPRVSLSWSPAGAARLITGSAAELGVLSPETGPLEFGYRLEVLGVGDIDVAVDFTGREADTGAPVTGRATGRIHSMPPPDLELRVRVQTATVLVGERGEFEVVVTNRGSVPARNMSPLLRVLRGDGRFATMVPIYQAVPARGRAVFKCAFVPSAEGPVEFTAGVSAQGEAGGPLVTVASNPADMLAVSQATFQVFSLHERLATGVTTPIRFRLVNPLKHPLRIKSARLVMTGSLAGPTNQWKVGGPPLVLAPGQGTTLFGRVFIPFQQGLTLQGSVGLAGEILPYRLPFTWQSGSRVFGEAATRSSARIVVMEPAGIFRPPVDPLMSVEYTLSRTGEAGLALVDTLGALVRVLDAPVKREAGWHSFTWDGRGEKGKLLPGRMYRLLLAGPVSRGKGPWPEGAVWSDFRNFTLAPK